MQKIDLAEREHEKCRHCNKVGYSNSPFAVVVRCFTEIYLTGMPQYVIKQLPLNTVGIRKLTLNPALRIVTNFK